MNQLCVFCDVRLRNKPLDPRNQPWSSLLVKCPKDFDTLAADHPLIIFHTTWVIHRALKSYLEIPTKPLVEYFGVMGSLLKLLSSMVYECQGPAIGLGSLSQYPWVIREALNCFKRDLYEY